MNRPALLAACAAAAAGYLARSELTRRTAAARRPLSGEHWLLQAVYRIWAAMEPAETLVSVTIAVQAADGQLIAYAMDPGDTHPDRAAVVETGIGDGRTALEFFDLNAPDDVSELEGGR